MAEITKENEKQRNSTEHLIFGAVVLCSLQLSCSLSLVRLFVNKDDSLSGQF